MTVLTAMRWTLLGSLLLYGLGLVMGGWPMAIAGTLAIAIGALGCVVIQLARLVGRRRHKLVERPE
ncbi:hypothetical protein [Sphingomonas bacterium]|uniref:hypothetical protein n=1 Tax=Sphingomonas bacterium TaxID=1895847 RepID=UPI00262E26CD|nr:hypothetical protein [Sphingomonas bacterium]MDB5677081.1 hypothetical protein [Sphingomonas bacterium]